MAARMHQLLQQCHLSKKIGLRSQQGLQVLFKHAGPKQTAFYQHLLQPLLRAISPVHPLHHSLTIGIRVSRIAHVRLTAAA